MCSDSRCNPFEDYTRKLACMRVTAGISVYLNDIEITLAFAQAKDTSRLF